MNGRSTRRRFLGEASCAALSGVAVLNTLLNLKLAQRASAQAAPTDYKTLVCLFLNGGNDSFNWLVPRDAARHGVYQTARGNLALAAGSLLPLNQVPTGDGQLYGIHPSCAGLQELFNGLGGDSGKRRAAFVTNVGTLIQPTSKAQYLAETVPLPRALFSHSDQIDQWQTSVPQGMSQLSGWGGRAADVLHGTANTGMTSMSLSLSGNNLFQVGNVTQQFVITEDGALTLRGPETDAASDPANPLRLKNGAQRSILEQQYASLMQESYARLTRGSVEAQEFFLQQFNSYDDSAVAGLFPETNSLARQLRAAAKVIALRPQLGLRRQTLFVGMGGWDHHGELLNTQAGMLAAVSVAVTGFQKALDQLGLQDTVVTFTASDFGRTLRSNGRGTDHAWGGNALVLGGPVRGGRVCGTFPDLTLDGPDDTGYGGRLVPTLSVDALFGEMLNWFGVPPASLSLVLPNAGNFFDAASSPRPVGFLA
jgi:uncharacterized protein (DUF1501 family)